MENTSIRGRFSLSTTNLTNPIAESTCLNGLSTNPSAKFNWGEGSIISRSRNNTQVANKTASNSKNLNGTPSKVTMSPTSRIDARTYVDIHSNGLASRIVKYHDNSARLNRSLSMGNLYNKPGQFPVVHLRKNEQQYKAKKCKNLSMTKIAAPEKSVFHGNTLSSILRSGSIVGLQKTDEEISRENRPILHPPPTENEMAPTRSVLEVLKEISRKRINSDEIDGTDLIKKPCKEPEFDTNSYNGQKVQSKRQREISSPVSSIQLSPEQQVVKKRMCNYNNDILSSLSSSILSFNKKKMHELQSQKRNVSELITCNSSISNCSENGPLRNGKQRCQESFELENLVHSIKYTPITPLPSTPQQSTVNSDVLNKALNIQITRRASEPVITNTKPRLTLFNKDYDEVPSYLRNDTTEPKDDGGLSGIQFVKPKKISSLSSDGTLLMEKTKQSKLALMLKGLKGELDEEDEVDAPPKVEPPKRADGGANSVVTSTVSSSSSQVSISFGTTTTAATVISTTNTTSKPISSPSTTTSGMKNDLQISVPPTPVSVSVTSSSSNRFQINPMPAITSTATSAAPPTIITTAASSFALSTTTTVTSTGTSAPSLGGFSFGLNKPLQPQTSTSQETTSKTTVPQLTIATATPATIVPTLPPTTSTTKPFSFGLSTTQVPTSTSTSTSLAPTFNFAAPNNSLSTASPMQANTMNSAFVSIPPSAPKTTEAPLPMFGQTSATVQPTFSFGSLASSSANPQMQTTSSTLTTNAPTFNFGAPKNSSTLSMTPASANSNPSPSLGPFVNHGPSVSVLQSTATIPPATVTGGFSFSGSSSSEAPKPLFSSMVSSTSTALNSNGKFTFSTNKTPITQANSPGTTLFGSPAAPSVPTTNSAQPPAFGNVTPVKPSNSFSFGTPVVPSTPVKPSFSFSAGVKPVVPATTVNNSVGGFSFNPPPAASSFAAPDPSKNMFSNTAVTVAPSKPVFAFGSATTNAPNKPTIFGASEVKSTNLFGASTTTTAQSSPFTFESSTSTLTNQGPTSTLPSSNIFGAAPSNTPSNGLGVPTSSSSSIFGTPSAAVAPIQQSSSFAFGSGSSITTAESNKPSGGFVFGSSSSIGSNASKPTTELNKTFVFGDASTTISPAPSVTPNLFGGSSTNTNNATVGGSENKLFSFGAVGAGATGNSSNTFGGNRQMVNQSPVFNFGASAANTQPPAQNGNLFVPQPAGAQNTMMPPGDRPTRKAVRRLHKT